MRIVTPDETQINRVGNFQDLVSTPFQGGVHAICWPRTLAGDFEEILNQVAQTENIVELDEEQLLELRLSTKGQLARDILLHDLKLLKTQGASPTLNLIHHYERDDVYPFFPTDVYSFHVDRSPIPTATYLCTYYGAPSEILPNALAEQKVLVPEIREELRKLYTGSEQGFESFLREHFFDLHYRAKPQAVPISLGVGNLWRLAVDYPNSNVLPCVHRAPLELTGQSRLLLIC